MELYLIITTSHLTIKDPEVSWPELLWTPTGSISHRVFVSLVGEVPLSGGSILSRVPWNPSASSWLPLILINQLQSVCVCVLHGWAAVAWVWREMSAVWDKNRCTGYECESLWQMVVARSSGPDSYNIPFQIKHTKIMPGSRTIPAVCFFCMF